MTTELVERARGGDATAFARLIETRVERMYRLAVAILGHDADARDAAQEAMAAIWRELPALRDPARFDAWSDRILVNACRPILRRRARARVREVALDLTFTTDEPAGLAPVAPPDEAAADQDELERAFERLSVDERALLVLHHLEARPVAEIADRLGIPVGTAKSRIHHARKSLQWMVERGRR